MATPSNLENYYATHDSEAGLAKPLLADEAPIAENPTQETEELGHAIDPRHSQGGHGCKAASGRCTTLQTTAALLTLQLGWGLWLLPCDFARLGWIPGFVTLGLLALFTTYSGTLFTRLYAAVPKLELPLWQCSVISGVVVLLLGQIRYLTQLSSFFMAGTLAQMVALAIVVYDLVVNAGHHTGAAAAPAADGDSGPLTLLRYPYVAEKLVDGNWAPAAMAVLNMIFAYGGQFAFIELITSMREPRRFSNAVSLCTTIMTALYGGFGAVGYWSKGASVHGIVIFNMHPGPAAQIAAAFIFLQALAQYLVNLNVWTHNLLVLLSRRKVRGGPEGESWEEETHAKNTGDHSSGHWLAATAFVAAYSAVVAVAVPFFCTLVGLVTSLTYLTCAYTLPAWFALKLLGSKLGGAERCLLVALIPVTLVLSALGFAASVKTYITEASGGEGM